MLCLPAHGQTVVAGTVKGLVALRVLGDERDAEAVLQRRSDQVSIPPKEGERAILQPMCDNHTG